MKKIVSKASFIQSVLALGVYGAAGSAYAFTYQASAPAILSTAAMNPSAAQGRCVIDQFTEDAQAQARLTWATGCNLVNGNAAVFHYSMDDDGNKLPLTKLKYPLFAYLKTDGTPDLTKGKDGVFIPEAGSCTLPAGVVYYEICQAGCYAPDQKVLFADGQHEMSEAFVSRPATVVTLAKDSTLNAPKLQDSPVQYWVASERDASEDLLTIQTAAGGKLTVTKNHPLVKADGHMVEALSLKAGDSLVTQSGALDRIQSIEVTPYFGKVYNLAPHASDAIENIVVAEGFLSGSHKFQSSALLDYATFVLRPTVPAALAE